MSTEPQPVTVEFRSRSASALDATVVVAGQDLTRVTRGIRMECEAGEPARIAIDLYALNGLAFILPAVVTLNVMVVPSYDLIREDREDGSVRWHAEPAPLTKLPAEQREGDGL